MQSNQIRPIITVFFGLGIAIIIFFNILTTGGNLLGATFRYVLAIAFIIGFIMPKFSMTLQLLAAVWIDVLKKSMVVDGSMYFADVFFILGAPPVMLLGATLSYIVQLFLRKSSLPFSVGVKLLGLATIVVLLLSVFPILRGGLQLATLKLLANSAAYSALIFVFPMAYPTNEERLHYLKMLCLIMIPIIPHAIAHVTVGLAEFEYIYTMSSFSTQSGTVIRGEGVFGPFPSQGALSGTATICSCIVLFALVLRKYYTRRYKIFFDARVAIVLGAVFLFTAIISYKRMPVAVLPVAGMAYYVLRNKFRTLLGYVAVGLVTFCVVYYSDVLRSNLPEYQSAISSLNASLGLPDNLVRVQTFNVRLEEFMQFKNSDYWTPFGIDMEEDGAVHSWLVEILIRFGYVPLAVSMVLIIPVQFILHQKLWNMKAGLSKDITIGASALYLAIKLVSVAGSGFVNTYPIAFIDGLIAAMIISTIVLTKYEDKPRQPKVVRQN